MEPFWFLAGIVVMLPYLEAEDNGYRAASFKQDGIDLSDMGLIRGVFPIECELLDESEAVQLKIIEYL